MVEDGIFDEGRRCLLNNHSFKVLGFTLACVFADLCWTSLTRDLDCVEVFSGPSTHGSIAKAAEQAGQTAAVYEAGSIEPATVWGFDALVWVWVWYVLAGKSAEPEFRHLSLGGAG